LHLSVYLEDGTEVLSSVDDEPLRFSMGDGTLAPGLESLLLDLPVGADEQILADGALVFGSPDDELIRDLPRSDLPEGFTAGRGEVVLFDAPGGQQTPGTVIGESADALRVDFNHPLSRRGLRLRIQVLSVA
jgi:FKBP-type peptidyl-prolyl cis-trans isomerase SlpA